MKSNQFFSPARFFQLLRHDLIINHKRYIFTTVGALIAGFLLLYSTLPSKHSLATYPALAYLEVFLMTLLALGAFVGLSFPEINNKLSTAKYLLLPASIFEKFMAQFVVRILFGSLVFLSIFWIDAQLVRAIIVSSAESIGLTSNIEPFSYGEMIKGFNQEKEFSIIIIGIVAIGFYLFSVRLFFAKFGLVKSLITLIALGYLFMILMVTFSHIFYPETIGFNVNVNNYVVYKGFLNMDLFAAFVAVICFIALLPLGYFKLKEKQL